MKKAVHTLREYLLACIYLVKLPFYYRTYKRQATRYNDRLKRRRTPMLPMSKAA